MPHLTVMLLALCQAMMTVSNSMVVTTSALVGLALAPSLWMATLPAALQHIGAMLCALPASVLMNRYGRKPGFALAGCLGVAGALVAYYGIAHNDFWLFALATFMFGLFNGFGAFFRFAAVEVAPESAKHRAISLTLAGGVVAALIGPSFAGMTRESVAGHPFAGSYAALIGVFVVVLIAVNFMRMPRPSVATEFGAGRALGDIAQQMKFRAAVASCAIGFAMMTLLMTATPLAMKAQDYPFSHTTQVIQWHVFAMFAPSFFTGRIIERLGLRPVLIAGAVTGLACIAVSISGSGFWHYFIGLFLLGLSWNFAYVGGTSLLTECYQPEERARVQAVNDLLVFTLVALAAFGAAPLLQLLGWIGLNLFAVPFYLFLLVILLKLKR